MEKISTKALFDAAIKQIWHKEDYLQHPTLKPILQRGYWLQDEIPLNALLFIGINPSFTGEEIFLEHYYNLKQADNFNPAYHKVFEEIAKRANLTWSHHDLLFFRETKQLTYKSIEKDSIIKQFVKEQLNISKQIIILSKPKIIIVANATARQLMGKWNNNKANLPLDFQFEFSSDLGIDIIVDQEGMNGTPIFFTSMLSGQRMLDLGSMERLEWHIKFVLNQLYQR